MAKAQEGAARATVAADRAALDQARLNLSYMRVVAPSDGTVAERSVQLGNYVSPGAGLMAVVPLGNVYVDANFREVQLAHVKGGQHATVHVDTYGVDLQGTVVGVPAATGATFATIPAEDATGNFTKVVQRLPVEVRVDPGQSLARLAFLRRPSGRVPAHAGAGRPRIRADRHGGPGATLNVDESIPGVIDALEARSGSPGLTSFNYKGDRVPW